jgi:hypothetical protein
MARLTGLFPPVQGCGEDVAYGHKGKGILIHTLFQQERCFAWFQRKYRRLVVRWERISACFDAFLSLGTIHIWINRILLVG